MKGEAFLPGSTIGLEAEELRVDFDYTPGSDASGLFGLPEDYDPGEGPEIDGVSVYDGEERIALSNEDDEKVVAWLFANFEFVDDGPDWPEPDDFD